MSTLHGAMMKLLFERADALIFIGFLVQPAALPQQRSLNGAQRDRAAPASNAYGYHGP
jgi:hypothetical protein